MTKIHCAVNFYAFRNFFLQNSQGNYFKEILPALIVELLLKNKSQGNYFKEILPALAVELLLKNKSQGNYFKEILPALAVELLLKNKRVILLQLLQYTKGKWSYIIDLSCSVPFCLHIYRQLLQMWQQRGPQNKERTPWTPGERKILNMLVYFFQRKCLKRKQSATSASSYTAQETFQCRHTCSQAINGIALLGLKN